MGFYKILQKTTPDRLLNLSGVFVILALISLLRLILCSD